MIWRLLDAGLLLAGLACVTIGVAQVYRPAAWIVAGLAMVALAIVPGVRR